MPAQTVGGQAELLAKLMRRQWLRLFQCNQQVGPYAAKSAQSANDILHIAEYTRRILYVNETVRELNEVYVTLALCRGG